MQEIIDQLRKRLPTTEPLDAQDDATALPSGGHGSPDVGSTQARAEAARGDSRAPDEGFKKILLLLREHCGVDFSFYKSTTIQRRIRRRFN